MSLEVYSRLPDTPDVQCPPIRPGVLTWVSGEEPNSMWHDRGTMNALWVSSKCVLLEMRPDRVSPGKRPTAFTRPFANARTAESVAGAKDTGKLFSARAQVNDKEKPEIHVWGLPISLCAISSLVQGS